MTERFTEELTIEAQRLSELKSQQADLNGQVKQQEGLIKKIKANFLGIAPDSLAAEYSGSIIQFANENNSDPQWLAGMFMDAIRNVRQHPTFLDHQPTDYDGHVKHYEYSLELIKKGRASRNNPYRFIAEGSLAKARQIAENEEEIAQDNSKFRESAYYTFLQGHLAVLQEAHMNYYLSHD